MSINSISLSAHNRVLPSKNNFKEGKNHYAQNEGDVSLTETLDPVEKTIISSIAPVRRAADIPVMLKKGETAAALGLAGLIAVSLPEDIRDLKDAFKQSKSVIGKNRYTPAYNYRKYQHDFSFLRGTLLHEGLKRIKSEKGKSLVNKIFNADKTLYHTKLGKLVQKVLGIKNGKLVSSQVKTLFGKELPVQQVIIKKDFFKLKDLTARALKRTSILGIAFMSLLELPRVVKSFTRGEATSDKLKSGGTQAAKSSINILGVTAGMGYVGALGAKKYGSVGSLIGMGLGAIIGATASKQLQNAAFKKETKA